MKIVKLCWYLLGLLATIFSLAVRADEYQLELLVFSQSTVNTELFTNTKSNLTIPDNAIEIAPATTAEQETLVEIPLNGLKKAAEKLGDSADYAIVLQKAWKQKLLAGQSNPIIRLQDPNGSLNGYINFSEDGSAKVKLDVEYFGTASSVTSHPLVYRVSEKRKLKSGEPQYFDHPKFGIIVLATNLTPPPPPVTPVTTSPATDTGGTEPAVPTPAPVVQPTVPTNP